MNLLVCGRCGERADAVRVIPGPMVRCDVCGHRWAFRQLPLYCVTGPSGTGKSTVASRLHASLADRYVILEQDVLWQAGLQDDSDDHRAFRTAWLRMAAMIHQNGRPVVLCGTVVPPELEPLPERALFSRIHYLSLMCEPGVLRDRLRARPAWRQWDEPRIAEMLEYASWIEEHAHAMEPPMTLLDTTAVSVDRTGDAVRQWILADGGRSTGEGSGEVGEMPSAPLPSSRLPG